MGRGIMGMSYIRVTLMQKALQKSSLLHSRQNLKGYIHSAKTNPSKVVCNNLFKPPQWSTDQAKWKLQKATKKVRLSISTSSNRMR